MPKEVKHPSRMDNCIEFCVFLSFFLFVWFIGFCITDWVARDYVKWWPPVSEIVTPFFFGVAFVLFVILVIAIIFTIFGDEEDTGRFNEYYFEALSEGVEDPEKVARIRMKEADKMAKERLG